MKLAKTNFLTNIFVTVPVAIGLTAAGAASTDSVGTFNISRAFASTVVARPAVRSTTGRIPITNIPAGHTLTNSLAADMTTGQLLTSNALVNRWRFTSVESPSQISGSDFIDFEPNAVNEPEADLELMFQSAELREMKSTHPTATTYTEHGGSGILSSPSRNLAASTSSSITPALTTAPEPDTTALLGFGFAIAALAARKRFTNQLRKS